MLFIVEFNLAVHEMQVVFTLTACLKCLPSAHMHASSHACSVSLDVLVMHC